MRKILAESFPKYILLYDLLSSLNQDEIVKDEGAVMQSQIK